MARGGNNNRRANVRNKGDGTLKPTEPSKVFNDIERAADSEIPNEPQNTRTSERRFSVLVDSVPYMVTATPFSFNDEIRYRVSFNGSTEHVFTWDSSLGQLRAINDDSSTLPDNLELAISEMLQSKM